MFPPEEDGLVQREGAKSKTVSILSTEAGAHPGWLVGWHSGEPSPGHL